MKAIYGTHININRQLLVTRYRLLVTEIYV